MIGAVSLAALASALQLFAAHAPADSTQPVRTLPPIEVTRERVLLDARRRLPTAEVTDLATGAANRALESLPELLSSVAGARVVQYGGLGAFSTLSLRGAPAGQVSLYLDGVPITSAAHGIADLSELPLSAIERVEVYRGASPSSFGPPSPGGAINLVSAETPTLASARIATGSFGTALANGTLAGRRGALALLAHAGYEGSRGDFPFRTDNGTPFNPDDDRLVTRVNARFDAATGEARLAWTPTPRWRASVREELFGKRQGVPGLASVQAANPSLAFARALTAADLALAPGDDAPGLTLRADLARERTRFLDSHGELGFGWQDTDQRFTGRGVALEAATPAGWAHVSGTFGAGARDEREGAPPPTADEPTPPESRRVTESGWLALQLHLLGNRALLHAARRWDRQDDHLRTTGTAGIAHASDARRTLDAPQLGARFALPFGLSARANWTRTARAPDFLELFGDQAETSGNPLLQPERAEGWDAGGDWARAFRSGLSLGAGFTHHASHPRGLIVFQRFSQSSVRARNVGAAELRGEESTWRAAWRGLAASGSLSWLSAIDSDPRSLYYGRRLPQRPERQAYARLDAHAGPWSAAVDLQTMSDDFLDPINFTVVPARRYWGASLARRIGPLTFTLEGKNLADEHTSDVGGFPLPGRSVFAACELRSDPTPHPSRK